MEDGSLVVWCLVANGIDDALQGLQGSTVPGIRGCLGAPVPLSLLTQDQLNAQRDRDWTLSSVGCYQPWKLDLLAL